MTTLEKMNDGEVKENKNDPSGLHNFDKWKKFAYEQKDQDIQDSVNSYKQELADAAQRKTEALKNFEQVEKPLFAQEVKGIKTDTLISATNLNRESGMIDINNMIQLPIMSMENPAMA